MDRQVDMFPEYDLPAIEDETELQPRLIAARVCQEAVQYLYKHSVVVADVEGLIRWLTERASDLYKRNPPFRRKIKSLNGREHLLSCMRSWLANRLEKTHPGIRARLPEHFAGGAQMGSWSTQTTS